MSKLKTRDDKQVAAAGLKEWDAEAGRAYEAGDFAGAIELWTKALEAAGDSENRAAVLGRRAEAWARRERADLALADLDAVLMLPGLSQARRAVSLYCRAGIHGMRGAFTDGISDVTAVLAFADAPEQLRALALNRRGAYQAKKQNSGAALEDFAAVMALAGAPVSEKVRAVFSRGNSRQHKGEWELAIAEYEGLLKMPDAPAKWTGMAWGNIGWCRYLQGKLGESIEASRRALEMEPGDRNARFNVGLALLAQGGHVAEAVEEYRKGAALCKTQVQLKHDGVDDLAALRAKMPGAEGTAEAMEILEKRRGELPEK